MHTRRMSAIKAVSWRLIGIVMLAVITWNITQSYITTGIIVLLHHMSFICIYYYHERIWNKRHPKGRPFFKALAYEIGLGFLVLGVITLVVTGSWKQMTDITLLYLGLRLIGYPIHEWFYERRN